jgi:hypothetical protein
MVTSRPGNRLSIRDKNAGSMAIVSSKCPCTGHVFSITILPSFSWISALISPGLSWMRWPISSSPRRIAVRASLTHTGHRLSVSRGQPSGGFVRAFPRGMGESLHFGLKGWGSGATLFAAWIADHTLEAE